jgi:hypothetical protein
MAWICAACGGRVQGGYERCVHCGAGRWEERDAALPRRVDGFHDLLLRAAVLVLWALAALTVLLALLNGMTILSDGSGSPNASLILLGGLAGACVLAVIAALISKVLDIDRNLRVLTARAAVGGVSRPASVVDRAR